MEVVQHLLMSSTLWDLSRLLTINNKERNNSLSVISSKITVEVVVITSSQTTQEAQITKKVTPHQWYRATSDPRSSLKPQLQTQIHPLVKLGRSITLGAGPVAESI